MTNTRAVLLPLAALIAIGVCSIGTPSEAKRRESTAGVRMDDEAPEVTPPAAEEPATTPATPSEDAPPADASSAGAPSDDAVTTDPSAGSEPAEDAPTSANVSDTPSAEDARRDYADAMEALHRPDGAREAQRLLEPLLGAFAEDVAMQRDVRVNLSRALLDVEPPDVDRALDLSAQATAFDDSSSIAWNVRGRALLSAERLDEAETAFRRACELDGANLYARNNHGYVLLMRGEYERAASSLEEARATAARTGQMLPAYVLNNLGVALERSGRVDEARAVFEEAAAAGSERARANLESLSEPTGDDRVAAVDETTDETDDPE